MYYNNLICLRIRNKDKYKLQRGRHNRFRLKATKKEQNKWENVRLEQKKREWNVEFEWGSLAWTLIFEKCVAKCYQATQKSISNV